MKKIYAIREGFSVRMNGNPEVYLGGGVVELDDADAAAHIHKLDELTHERQAELDAERAAAAELQVQRDLDAEQKRQIAVDQEAAIQKELAKQAAAEAVKAKGDVKQAQAVVNAAEATTDAAVEAQAKAESAGQ